MSRDWMLFAWGMFTGMGGSAVVEGRWFAAAVLFGLGIAFNVRANPRPRA